MTWKSLMRTFKGFMLYHYCWYWTPGSSRGPFLLPHMLSDQHPIRNKDVHQRQAQKVVVAAMGTVEGTL